MMETNLLIGEPTAVRASGLRTRRRSTRIVCIWLVPVEVKSAPFESLPDSHGEKATGPDCQNSSGIVFGSGRQDIINVRVASPAPEQHLKLGLGLGTTHGHKSLGSHEEILRAEA